MFLIVLFTVAIISVYAEVVASFPDMARPYQILVHEGKLYALEGQTVSIYSTKDYKLLKTFGQRGEGPREFMGELSITAYPDCVIINSLGKVSYWTKTGEFIKEIKSHAEAVAPLGDDKYVGLSFMRGNEKDKTHYLSIMLYDSHFNTIRVIKKREAPVQSGKGLLHFIQSYDFINSRTKNWIYTIGHEGMKINVFNEKGEKQWSIDQPYKKLKVTDKDRKAVHDFYKRDPRHMNRYDAIKHTIKFNDYKPAINKLQEFDGLLYAETYNTKDGKTEFYIFDQKGKLLKRIFLPVIWKDFRTCYPYFIDKGKLYHLVENEDEEIWKLHTKEIKL